MTDTAKRRFWRRPWVVPLMLGSVAFLAYSLPPYLTLDPGQSRLPVDAHPLFYPLLVTHIFCGTVALLAGCFQVWPWFRGRFPVAHRWIGRSYFFLGIFPAGIAVMGVAPFSSSGFVSQVGNTMLGVLWLVTGVSGYRMARQRRYPEHRKWMIRSFALTTSIVVNRFWAVICYFALLPHLETVYGGDETAMTLEAAEASVWLSWVVNLLIAEWWLMHTDPARKKAKQRAAANRAKQTAEPQTPARAPAPTPVPVDATEG
jgi:uncharacterized membrane protein HdeD (DUF308 family)